MDDVLISQLPVTLLRSTLRVLVSQGTSVQKPFVEHVRKHLTESPPPYPSPEDLFSSDSVPTPAILDYLASTRCLFSSKLVVEAIPYLTYFVRSIPAGKARWTAGSTLELTLEQASGDIIQAIQALKELNLQRDGELWSLLENLDSTLLDCGSYCEKSSLSYPFTRATLQVHDAMQLLFPDSFTPSSGNVSAFAFYVLFSYLCTSAQSIPYSEHVS